MNTRVEDEIFPITVRQKHLKVKSGEHIVILPLTFKKTKPSKPIGDHLLQCDNNPSLDEKY